MLHLHDRATMGRALTLDLNPRLHELLAERVTALGKDLIDHTEYLIVEAGDTEADIIRHIGFSPLVNPIDGVRYPDHAFEPWWDYLANRNGWFELIMTFGSTFACVLIIAACPHGDPTLIKLCEQYASK